LLVTGEETHCEILKLIANSPDAQQFSCRKQSAFALRDSGVTWLKEEETN
jgi:hypothetical protein